MTQAGPQTHAARRALEIAFAALDQPDAVRHAWARAECGDDAALAAEVEALLDADLADEPRLDSPALNEDLADARIGSRIGRYRISARIGTGGMGVVYHAEPEEGVARQPVALKLIKRGMDSEEILRRFMREREILGRLEHPHIARLLDGGMTDDGSPWFALELVQGEPLTRYCDQHQLSLAQRIGLFLQVCEAVEYAHRNLVIHRDLKPGNVLVTPDAQVKLLDFGIARLVDTEPAQATRTRAVVLTPEYSAPEQFERGHITTQTDVYQLGVLLGELLSGQRPARPGASAMTQGSERLFSSLSARSTEQDPELLSRAQARAISVRGLVRALRGDLDRIVRKAIHTEPERRYASAFALAEDLRRYLGGRPVLAMGDSLGYWLGKFVQRNRWGVAGLLTILVSVAVGWITTAREAERLRIALDQSSAMQTLLEEVFLGADPWEAKGVDTLASDLLRATEEKLQTQLHLSPALASDLWFKIGSVHVELLQDAAAKHAMQRSIEAADAALSCAGTDCVGVDGTHLHIQQTKARARLAHLRLVESPSDAVAMQELQAAIDTLRKFGAAVASDLADALIMKVHILIALDVREGVREASEEALAITEREYGADADETLRKRAAHSVVLRQLGFNAESLAHAEQAYQQLWKRPGKIALPLRMLVAKQFGGALSAVGRQGEAESVLTAALAEGAEHDTAVAISQGGLWWELTNLRYALGNYQGSADAARQFLATGSRLSDAERAYGRNALGHALLAAGDAAAAWTEYTAARTSLCAVDASAFPCLIVTTNLVDVLQKQQRWTDARQQLDALASIAEGHKGRLALRIHLLEARQHLGIGNIAEAALSLAASRTAGAEIANEEDRIAWILLDAHIARARKKHAEALRLYDDVVAYYQSKGNAAAPALRSAREAIQSLRGEGK